MGNTAALGAAAAGLGGCASTLGLAGIGPHAARKDFPRPRFAKTNGIRMAYYEQGNGFPVVFSHGFPELAYSWRFQLPALEGAGLRAIAPDQRGYGLTDAPREVAAYSMQNLCGDLAGLLDHLQIERAVFCGHDWGGVVVWMMPLLHPDRVAGVIGVNTPFLPRSPISPLQLMRQLRGENNYIVFFQQPGVADEMLGRDVRRTFEALMRKGGVTAEEFNALAADAPERNFELSGLLEGDLGGEPLLTEHELDFYVSTFERTGFTGGINWYRNIDRNWETTAELRYRVNVPGLMISAEDDVVLPPSMTNGMENFVPDLEKRLIEGSGHWTQQEKPEELNRLIIDWVKRRFG